MKFSAVQGRPVKRWVVAWVFNLIGKKISQKKLTTNVVSYQARPQQTSKVFKKVTNVRVNFRPGETDPYVNMRFTSMAPTNAP